MQYRQPTLAQQRAEPKSILFDSNKFYNDTSEVCRGIFLKSLFSEMKIEWS